jgi:predicted amino acid dehydrogenase
VDANYYLFAKALGGGYEKIGALLIESAHYQKEFDKYYSSTFANGGLAAFVAREVIKVVQRDQIPERARERGEHLRQKLSLLRSEYPDVIQAIRGKGLMLGICFTDFSFSDNIVLRLLAKEKMLGYLYASYLLNCHNIRILPSMEASNILRVEPSVYITDEEIDQLYQGIRNLADIINRRNIYQLCKHLMDGDAFEDGKGKEAINGIFYQGVDPPARNAFQVAFIGHFAYPVDELRAFERDFSQASDTGLRILSNRIQHLFEMKPVTICKKNIFHERIHLTLTIIPLDSAELERLHREGDRKKIIGKIQKAVDQSVEEGAKVVSLGGYTSILTNNGLSIAAPDDVQIITGNTLTVASGLRRVFDALKENKCFHRKNVIAIVGVPGNIATVMCEQMIRQNELFSELILVGRTMKKLERYLELLRDEIDLKSHVPVRVETDLKCLARCDVIINSTNTNDPIIFPHHIKKGSRVLIADNSIPAGVSEEVMQLGNVISLPFASYLKLPYDPDYVISSHTPRGTVFCCAAEGILCGLEKIELPLKGKITTESVDYLTSLAEKHGFFDDLGGIAGFKTGGRR